jgi:hypothetical protein
LDPDQMNPQDPDFRARAFAAMDRNRAIVLQPEIEQRIQRVYVELELLLARLREAGVREPAQLVAGMVAAAIVGEDRRAHAARDE